MTINAWQEEILFAHISHAAHHYCSIRFVAVKNCVYQQNEEKMYNITKYFVVIPLFLRLWLNHFIHHNIPFLLFFFLSLSPSIEKNPKCNKKNMFIASVPSLARMSLNKTKRLLNNVVSVPVCSIRTFVGSDPGQEKSTHLLDMWMT